MNSLTWGHFNPLARCANDRRIGLSITSRPTLIGYLSSHSRFQVCVLREFARPNHPRNRAVIASIIIDAMLRSATTRDLPCYRAIEETSNPLSRGQRLAFCVSASFCGKEETPFLPREITLAIRTPNVTHPVITAIFVGGSLKVECAYFGFMRVPGDPQGHRLEIFASIRIRFASKRSNETNESGREIMAKLSLHSSSFANVNPRVRE